MAGSSLLLAALLAAAPQARQDMADLQKKVQEFVAAKDDAAREAVLQALEQRPVRDLHLVEALMSSARPEALAAARRWMPHAIWRSLPAMTIGDARRKEAELLGPDSARRPEDFARAASALLEKGDLESQRIAVTILGTVRAPEPARLVPLVHGRDLEIALAAGRALAASGDPSAAREILREFKTCPPADARRWVLLVAQTSGAEITPELLDLQRAEPFRAPAVAQVLGRIGDARAEPALLALLPSASTEDLGWLVRSLSFLGGSASVAALRARRDGLPPGTRFREECMEAIVRIRPPDAAAEVIEELRAKRLELSRADDWLLRLGDPASVPPLVALHREGKLKLEDRKALLELIGALGSGDALDLLVDALRDERLAESTARGLAELGDPRAAGPLAEALVRSPLGLEIGRALLALPEPLRNVEAPLLEILRDPEGHLLVFDAAVRAAARSDSARLRATVLEWMTTPQEGFHAAWPTLKAFLPALRAEDREALARGRTSENRDVKAACTIGLASLGDEEARKEFVGLVLARRIAIPDEHARNALLDFGIPPGTLVEPVLAAFRENPKSLEAAEFLALQGKGEGADLLRDALRRRTTWGARRATKALLKLGDPTVVPWILEQPALLSVDRELEGMVAAALDEGQAAALRALAWGNRANTNHFSGRVLALRPDAEMAPFFLQHVLGVYEDNEVHEQTNDGAYALALAKLRVREVRPVLLRWLRSAAPGRRALAARALAQFGDPDALPAVAPLLEDRGELPRPVTAPASWQEPRRRVREEAVAAIEVFAKDTFAGSRPERLRAAKAWVARKLKE